ncbi:MAG: hypothetical protein U1E10_05080 [Bdellovibrionales bacterium]|nr:hypothetical protein [Bdellovibrionales bacterium]
MRRISKRPKVVAQVHTIDFLIISFGVHMLFAFLLSSNIFRDVAGKFGVESPAVSPFDLSQNNNGEKLIINYLQPHFVEIDPEPTWRTKYLDQPLLDSAKIADSSDVAKTSAEIDPNKKFVPCREFRCVASNKRGSHGRSHWLHISNSNRVERKYEDIPLSLAVPVIVSETSEPMNIYVTSDIGISLLLNGAPGARIARAVFEGDFKGLATNALNYDFDQSGQMTRVFVTKNILSSALGDHAVWHEEMKTKKYATDPREPAGIPSPPIGGPDQIVDVDEIIQQKRCADRIIYIGEDHRFKIDPEWHADSAIFATGPFLKEQVVNMNVQDPCARRSREEILSRNEREKWEKLKEEFAAKKRQSF